jgi:hypothetical protein
MTRSRTTLAAEIAGEIRRRVIELPGCVRLTMTARAGGGTSRRSLRPVVIGGETRWQIERVAGGRVTVRNVPAGSLPGELQALLDATGPREYHLVTADGDLHVRVTRKGRMLVGRGHPPVPPGDGPRPHDRVKRQPLDEFDSGPLLRVLGMTDGSGALRAAMRGKVAQVNAFLREVLAVLPAAGGGTAPLEIVDCGSGRAYLTLAACCYLTEAHGRRARVRGIERDPALAAQANRMAADLGVADDVSFVAADIATCRLEARPDLLLALHACDTATDAALARGVEWEAAAMLVAPCCLHNLQARLPRGGAMRALLRHGLLRERMADLLTDAFRAQLLRILGYRVRIVEFVAPEATPRNLMLRAVAGTRPGRAETVEEYRALRDFWGTTPHLETLLAERLRPWLT